LPDKYESGTPNLPGIAGLGAGIRFVRSKGEGRILKSELSLARRLYNGLSSIDGVKLYTDIPEEKSNVPVISFNIGEHDSESVASLLDERFNIAVRAGLHCAPLAHSAFGTSEQGTVRAVISVYTTPSQIDYFIASVNKITKLLPKKVAIGA
jgi:selenocysteine lyase/cysteine desulfurase